MKGILLYPLLALLSFAVLSCGDEKQEACDEMVDKLCEEACECSGGDTCNYSTAPGSTSAVAPASKCAQLVKEKGVCNNGNAKDFDSCKAALVPDHCDFVYELPPECVDLF